jgi:hypothetical protein
VLTASIRPELQRHERDRHDRRGSDADGGRLRDEPFTTVTDRLAPASCSNNAGDPRSRHASFTFATDRVTRRGRNPQPAADPDLHDPGGTGPSAPAAHQHHVDRDYRFVGRRGPASAALVLQNAGGDTDAHRRRLRVRDLVASGTTTQ